MKPSFKTLYSYFEKYAAEQADAVFIADEKTSYTAGRAFGTVKSLAKQLQDFGIRSGDYVTIKAERTVNCILIFYALQFIGAVAVMRDPREQPCGDRVIIGDTLYTCVAEARLVFGGKGGDGLILCGDSKQTSAIIFTSGSTGGSKAVRLSQYNFINNSLDTADIGGYRTDDINIMVVPLFHVFGMALVMTAVVLRHGIFVPERLETDYVLDCMERYGATRLNGVPSMYLALAERKGARKLRLNCGLIGGGPCTAEQFERIESSLGITLVPVYGMSECIGISCADYRDDIKDRRDGVGRVYSMNAVKIAEDGEILVKSPAMSQGYLDGEVTDSDGWLHTGDLGYLDGKGVLHIDGRKKDIIIRNGNNVSAADIERKILALASVKDACVVGVADEAQGEVPCAMIVADGEAELSAALNKIEMPAKVVYCEKIPLTSTGKHDKQFVKKAFSD